ncbi:MAG: polynucleotide adenylyltransferase PcnB, partial [Bacteroidales bacterium]|nr:polynucleotide adenylyltransferase PcnB [Bacteroidales bacterium]
MALQKAGGQVVAQQLDRLAIPRRFTLPMREIWDMQQRLPLRHGRRAAHLVELPRFRAAYDFVLLREQAGENLDDLGRWWTRYQDADESGRQSMVDALGSPGAGGGAKRRRRPRRKPSGGEQA